LAPVLSVLALGVLFRSAEPAEEETPAEKAQEEDEQRWASGNST